MAFQTKFNCEKNIFSVNPQIFFFHLIIFYMIFYKLHSCYFTFCASVAVQLGISDIALTMVVPWSLPDDLQDNTSEQKTIIERIFKEEVFF